MGIPCTFSRLAITELNVPFQCLRSDLSPVLGLPATDTAKLKAVVLPVVLSPDTCINKDFKSGLNCLRKESTGELKPNITAIQALNYPQHMFHTFPSILPYVPRVIGNISHGKPGSIPLLDMLNEYDQLQKLFGY